MERFFQWLLLIGTAGFSWFGMMIVHEAGHVLAALATGATVSQVILPVIGFSKTDLSSNPHPLIVAWGGAVLGSSFPLIVWALARQFVKRLAFLAQFFAGFCLVVNGAYIGGGLWIDAGDAVELLQYGAARWQFGVFGVLCVAAGLTLWNGLGRHFGLREASGKVDHVAAISAGGACAACLLVDFAATAFAAR